MRTPLHTRHIVTGALAAVATAGLLVTATGPASAEAASKDRPAAAQSDVGTKAPVRNTTCSGAPEGALVIDYADEDSICWVGSGRTDNPDTKDAVQIHTAANRGFVTVADDTGVHDVRFGPNETHNLRNGAKIRVIALNE